MKQNRGIGLEQSSADFSNVNVLTPAMFDLLLDRTPTEAAAA
jgi:hypothetical protein